MIFFLFYMCINIYLKLYFIIKLENIILIIILKYTNIWPYFLICP